MADFWLRKTVKRFAQYWGVVFASLPAGVLWLLMLRFAPPALALGISLPLALLAAFFVWRWLDRKIDLDAKPAVIFKLSVDGLSADPSFAVAGTLVVVMSVVVGNPKTLVYPLPETNESSNTIFLRNAVTNC